MTNDQEPQINPSRKDKLRPAELLGFSGVLAIFATLIVLMTTKDIQFALIVLALVFIVVLVVVALVGLGMKPNPEDIEARRRLVDGEEPDSTPIP